MGCVILLWHSLSLLYNYFEQSSKIQSSLVEKCYSDNCFVSNNSENRAQFDVIIPDFNESNSHQTVVNDEHVKELCKYLHDTHLFIEKKCSYFRRGCL